MVDLSYLPIDEIVDEVCQTVVDNGGAVLEAPPGAGKTTRVPSAVSSALVGAGVEGAVVVVEPRRLAARAAATRVAQEHRVELGGSQIGYQVRFDRRRRSDTKVVFVTPGILLGWLRDDPTLEAVACVVFDEFHERGVDTDLALALIEFVRRELRPGLRVIVMSATLDGEVVSRQLGLPRLRSEGRAFPVEIEYLPRQDDRHCAALAAATVGSMVHVDAVDGAVLVFLPGVGEIKRCRALLEAELAASRCERPVVELYGQQQLEQQVEALRGDSQRIVLATNLAESSVTVEGVVAVVDSGLHKILRYDGARGVNRLVTEPIPRASADQRAGRAGRQRSGRCVRLWSQSQHAVRPHQTQAEVARVDLAAAVLRLASIGVRAEQLPWIEEPSEGRLRAAEALLEQLGALKSSQLTELGQRMALLPLPPRLARLLIAGEAEGQLQHAAWTAALLSERDPLARRSFAEVQDMAGIESDLEERFEVLRRRAERADRGGGFGTTERAARQLVRSVKGKPWRGQSEKYDAAAFARALAAALPDRVALASSGTPDRWRALMVGGLGVIPGTSRVRGSGLLVALEVTLHGANGRLRLAHAIEQQDLPQDLVSSNVGVRWDEKRRAVEARLEKTFLDLVLNARTLSEIPEDLESQVSELVATHAAEEPEFALGLDQDRAQRFLNRARWLNRCAPELELPAVESRDLEEVARALSAGCRSLADLRARSGLEALRGYWRHDQLRLLDQQAPDRLELPSGRSAQIDYGAGQRPILATRIQDLFGWLQAPKLANGTQKLLLHLLAPNQRPAQITDDLEGFWRGSYAAVRKDLAGRYPKHDWPLDPLARATR